ncbi:protein kinase [Maioricimonas sp. JC845]|uniref:WD40 domain-containing protein n=1 Tax=Maioricimonas sp. JC845 TaxID=3232138 RepID=UPI00345B1949
MDRSHLPSSDNCPSRAIWEAFCLGHVSPDEQHRLAGHLEECLACQQLVAAANEVEPDDALLRRLRKRSGPPTDGATDPESQKTDHGLGISDTAHGPPLHSALGQVDQLPEGTTLGHFVIRRKLGEGGFGVVYLARDEQLQREVALKLPRQPRLLDPNSSARLIWEAQTAAKLDHRNLLPVYEVGEIDGTTFFASAYCPGPSLGRWLKTQNALPTIRDTVRMVIRLAEAVEHAHARGVLHRDIKPDNVLLEPVDEGGLLGGTDGGGFNPRLTDFGLAKCVEADSELAAELRTRTGVAFGTPPYMSPEQANGLRDRIDVRTDVYALGALMYRMLTGRPPITGASHVEILQRIESEQPVSPRQIRPEIPRDVQTICLKCLEKSSSRRYATAHELAEDLGRYLTGETIAARPAGLVERTFRAARKRPAAAVLVLMLMLAAVGLLTGLSIHNRRLGTALSRVESSERTARGLLYASTMSQAWDAWHSRDFVRAHEFLEASRFAIGDVTGPEDDLRGFEWHLLSSLTPPRLVQTTLGQHEGGTTCVRYSADGSLLASAGIDGIVRIWSMPDEKLRHVLKGHDSDVNRIEFSPDGSQLASASDDGTVRLWDVATGKPGHVLRGHPRRVFEVVWSQDGRRLASAGDGEGIRFWDAESGTLIKTLHAIEVSAMGLWPVTGRLVSVERSRRIRVFDFEQPLQIALYDAAHTRPVEKIAFADDGSHMLTASRDGTVREWDLETFQLLTLYQGHLDGVHDAVYLPGTDLIATASRDRTVRLWARSGRQMSVVRGHSDCVWSVDLAPDGETLVTGSRDGSVRLCRWKEWLHNDADQVVANGTTATEHSVAYSRDGRQIATTIADNTVERLSTDDLAETFRFGPVSDLATIVSVAFSPDGQSVLTGTKDGHILVRDATGGEFRKRRAHSREIFQLSFSPEGKTFTTCSGNGELRLWSWPEMKQIADLKLHDGWVLSACFSPDGKTLASCGSDGTAVLWDVATRVPRRVLQQHTGWVRDVAFSPDGRLIATAGNEGMVRLWNVSTGRLRRTLSLNDEQVFCLAFSPDGRTLVTGGSQTVRLWQTRSGQPLTVFRYPNYGACRAVAFSPDGQQLAAVAGSHPGTSVLRVWSVNRVPDEP